MGEYESLTDSIISRFAVRVLQSLVPELQEWHGFKVRLVLRG